MPIEHGTTSHQDTIPDGNPEFNPWVRAPMKLVTVADKLP